MAKLIPYLVFPGNCKKAIEFYAEVLEGSISSITTFEKSPIEVAPELKNRIFDSELIAGDIRIKASDDLPNHPVQTGSNFSLFVSFSNVEERKRVFGLLAKNGKTLFPLDSNFGMLKDEFNIQWMFVMG